MNKVCTELENSGGGSVERQDKQRSAAVQVLGEGWVWSFVILYSVDMAPQ